LKYVTDRYRSKSNCVSINAKAALIIQIQVRRRCDATGQADCHHATLPAAGRRACPDSKQGAEIAGWQEGTFAAFNTAGDFDQARTRREFCHAFAVRIMYARRQHGGGRRGAERLLRGVQEVVQSRAFDRENQPRVGTELPCSHGERSGKPPSRRRFRHRMRGVILSPSQI
jgi:hypothetical protein